ncbi:MAG: ABC transporter [Deltaproteobacteria bacterium HGW-Deltaproteobacteria-15]|nr:MAG: ABC transporter [Deltaproteobacteria bacterium HGW-Deltaproteobacteria-15]
MSENQIAVETQGLTKIYGSGNTQVIAMEDVTLRVKHGEVVALLGPSGAGKSTLLTSVGLINLPTSGKVMINGTPVIDGARSLTDLTRFRRNHIGYVFQKSNLIPFLSALENVQIALELNGWLAPKAKKRAIELLRYLDMADRAANYPAVARALANRPSLILADEPTAALDSQRGRQVMELFSKVAHEQQGAVIVVTHDHRALDVFDTIYEMEDGRIRLKTTQD